MPNFSDPVHKIRGLIWLRILMGHPYLSGVWLGVVLRTDTNKTSHAQKIQDYELKICLLLCVIVNTFRGDLSDHIRRKRIFTLIMNRIFV